MLKLTATSRPARPHASPYLIQAPLGRYDWIYNIAAKYKNKLTGDTYRILDAGWGEEPWQVLRLIKGTGYYNPKPLFRAASRDEVMAKLVASATPATKTVIRRKA